MRKPLFKKVNWLSVREIAEIWSPELGIPASMIEREMRIALYKMEIDYPWGTEINVNVDCH